MLCLPDRRISRRRERHEAKNEVTQKPWRRLQNPYPPMEILSAEQLERVHDAALGILERLGLEFLSDEALDILEDAGAEVERPSGLVRFPRELVESAIAKAPRSIELTARNPEKNVPRSLWMTTLLVALIYLALHAMEPRWVAALVLVVLVLRASLISPSRLHAYARAVRLPALAVASLELVLHRAEL